MEITVEYIIGMLIVVITGILYLWVNTLHQLEKQLLIHSIDMMTKLNNTNDASELYYLSNAELTALEIKMNKILYNELTEI